MTKKKATWRTRFVEVTGTQSLGNKLVFYLFVVPLVLAFVLSVLIGYFEQAN